jgi:choline dehydrogenase-like flavoprotein
MNLRTRYDVVIIGAGVGGGAMANRLAKAGATVLVIERGTRLPREADNWSVKAVFHDRKYPPTTTLAAIPNSSAPPHCAFAPKILQSWNTKVAAWHQPGQFHMLTSHPTTMKPNASWEPTAPQAWTQPNHHAPARCHTPPLATSQKFWPSKQN